MVADRHRFWDFAYGAVLLIAIPTALFHAWEGRWVQALLATIAFGIGVALLITGWNQPAETRQPAAARRSSRIGFGDAERTQIDRVRTQQGSYVGWLPMGAVSGFIATGVMTAIVLIGYAIAALLATVLPSNSLLQTWSAALIDNTITDVATISLAAAIAIHLVAGIAWALVFASIAEHRLPGNGPLRGMLFAVVPWVLSIVVFFPVLGAGFFGAQLGAGPLPVIGNLILHLVYGGVLGSVYTSHAIWSGERGYVSEENIRVLDVAHRMMAIGLLPGALLGLLVGILGTVAFAPDLDILMAAILGALAGSAFGVWIGSLAGLSPEDDKADGHVAA